ncbi:NAD-dependent dihydropyrimidine dehydrogenase subunit PreT [compost metagenome]
MSDTLLKADLPTQRLETAIPDLKPALTRDQALAEANRCLYCYDAPCVVACPTDINIPQFIKRISDDNVRGAAHTILESNILGHSCARVCPVEVLCAGSCVYAEKGEPPIMIGKLQRYATEYAYDHDIQFFQAGPATGKRIALVGGGPASLAAAHELRKAGHETVIFEGRSVPGGLNTTGVAPYKYHAEDALKEVAYVQAIGVEIRTNTLVGRDVSFEQLASEYDAVFLGVGLGPDSRLGIPGEDLPGCVGAVDWIERMKTEAGFTLNHVKKAIVIGGGNTAIDAARELKHLGVEAVTMVYRRGETEMSGYAHELAWARQEGVAICYWAAPAAVEGHTHVTGLRCARTQVGDDGKLHVLNEEFVLEADLVVRATGQEKLTALLSGVPGLQIERGRLVVDAETGQTGNAKYFAGGDCANGGKEVVNAAAEGKRAARGINSYLRHSGSPSEISVTIK